MHRNSTLGPGTRAETTKDFGSGENYIVCACLVPIKIKDPSSFVIYERAYDEACPATKYNASICTYSMRSPMCAEKGYHASRGQVIITCLFLVVRVFAWATFLVSMSLLLLQEQRVECDYLLLIGYVEFESMFCHYRTGLWSIDTD